jgi:putative transposase
VTAADALDRDGLERLLHRIKSFLPRLKLIWVDGGYQGETWAAAIKKEFDVDVEVVKKPDDQKGFVVLPRRWVIERTIAWLGRYRRLSKDYEHYPETSAGFVYLASIRRYLNILAQCAA